MSLNQKLAHLQDLYAEIDAPINAFQEKTRLACMFGCGECCTHFEPYISVLEGLLVAEYLQKSPARLASFYEVPRCKTQLLCPFYDPYSPRHCSIHHIRPLICRLFAFSATQHGMACEYTPCRIIEHHFPSQVALGKRLVPHELQIPVYHKIYQRLCGIDKRLACDLHPLTDSVEIALHNQETLATGQYFDLCPNRKNLQHYLLSR